MYLLTKIRYVDPEVEGHGPGMDPEPESWTVSVHGLDSPDEDLPELVWERALTFESALSKAARLVTEV